MSKKRSAAPRAGTRAVVAPTDPLRPVWVTVGALAATAALTCSFLLVFQHIQRVALPGCGADSPCARAVASVWGRIPGINWPTSFLGTTYFAAALTGWLAARGSLPRSLRWVARAGAVGSLLLGVVIAAENLYCPYCLGAHLGNFVFWIVAEVAGRRGTPARPRAPWLAALSVFALSSTALGAWDAAQRAATRARGEEELGQSIGEIIRQSQGTTPPTTTGPTTRPASPATTAPAGTVAAAATGAQTVDPAATGRAAVPPGEAAGAAGAARFEGRYRWGPEAAPIRIVLFTSYQCQDCLSIEPDVEQLMKTRSDVAISVKHFPMNSECNPKFPKSPREPQPNACWAARAAEAAGIRYGVDGFWKMHKWLFERRGVFRTTQELEAALRSFGYDPTGFEAVMTSAETLRRVQADCLEADALGLHFTPMIFVNGVELRGWHVPQALLRTVEAVAATNPPPRTAAADRPPTALEKFIGDWRENTALRLPADRTPHTQGPADAAVRVVLWGDFAEPLSREVDRRIRALVAERGDVHYAWRHFPFNSDCNPQLKDRRFPHACRLAAAAEAAALLGGEDAYWRMHAWLIEHAEGFSEDALPAAAAAVGLDPAALLAALDSAEARAAIADDVQASTRFPVLRLGWPRGIHGIPALFVQGKFVPRPVLSGQDVIGAIVSEAAQTAAATRPTAATAPPEPQ